MDTITYSTGPLTYYLKGEIYVEQNFLKLKLPKTILALIPLGTTKENVPVQQISSVSLNFKLNLIRFFAGLIIIMGANLYLSYKFTIILGIINLLWGLIILYTSFTKELRVATTAGKEYSMPFLIPEKDKALQAEQMINNIIAGRLNDTNNRKVAEDQTRTIVDAIKNIKFK